MMLYGSQWRNDSRVLACTVLDDLCSCFSGRDCPTVSKTSCCVENAFSFSPASDFPLTIFFIPTCTPTQAVWTFLLCFYDLPVLVDIYYLLSSGQIMCIESFCINVPLQCPNFFSWDLLLLWILSHPSLHFTVPDLSLEIHFLQELWKPQAIRVVGRGKWVSL